MKKLIIAIIVVLLVFLAYNFSQTGFAVFNKETKITFSPKEVKAGDTINVQVSPSKAGVDILMTIHSKNHLRKDSTDAWGNDCANYKKTTSTGSICKYPWKFKYRVPVSFAPGEYYFRFFDYSKREFVKSDNFVVKA